MFAQNYFIVCFIGSLFSVLDSRRSCWEFLNMQTICVREMWNVSHHNLLYKSFFSIHLALCMKHGMKLQFFVVVEIVAFLLIFLLFVVSSFHFIHFVCFVLNSKFNDEWHHDHDYSVFSIVFPWALVHSLCLLFSVFASLPVSYLCFSENRVDIHIYLIFYSSDQAWAVAAYVLGFFFASLSCWIFILWLQPNRFLCSKYFVLEKLINKINDQNFGMQHVNEVTANVKQKQIS